MKDKIISMCRNWARFHHWDSATVKDLADDLIEEYAASRIEGLGEDKMSAEALSELIYQGISESLKSIKLQNVFDEEGEHLPLVDLLSIDQSTISSGNKEVESIIDTIALDVDIQTKLEQYAKYRTT